MRKGEKGNRSHLRRKGVDIESKKNEREERGLKGEGESASRGKKKGIMIKESSVRGKKG